MAGSIFFHLRVLLSILVTSSRLLAIDSYPSNSDAVMELQVETRPARFQERSTEGRGEDENVEFPSGGDLDGTPGVVRRSWQKSSLKAWGKRTRDRPLVYAADWVKSRWGSADESQDSPPSRVNWPLVQRWTMDGLAAGRGYQLPEEGSINVGADGGDDVLVVGDGNDDNDVYWSRDEDPATNQEKTMEDKRSGWKKNRLKIWGKRSLDFSPYGINRQKKPMVVDSVGISLPRSLTPDGPKRNWQNNILRLWG